MKSRITIEIDFDNNNEPYIEVLLANNSDDVRDKILKNFTERLLMNNISVKFNESYEIEDGAYKKYKLIPNLPINTNPLSSFEKGDYVSLISYDLTKDTRILEKTYLKSIIMGNNKDNTYEVAILEGMGRGQTFTVAPEALTKLI